MALSKLKHIQGPLVLASVVLFSLFLGEFVPTHLKAIAYGISLTIKEALIFILPFLVFSFVFSSMVNLRKGALSFVLLLIPLVCLSSYIATWVAYFSGNALISDRIAVTVEVAAHAALNAPWNFHIPKLISNDIALFSGLCFGLIAAFQIPQRASHLSTIMLRISNGILNRFFIPIMPIFILGFTLKLQHDQVLDTLVENYLGIFLIVLTSVFSYLLFAYFALAKFQIREAGRYLRNMFPAFVTGFSTMSSAAALPFSLRAGEQNTTRPELARSVIPATVNIHLIGDCFATPTFALAILISFGMGLPDVQSYAMFALFFVLAKFAVAAVPGGGILAMLPVLEQHLGFSGEMLSLITALYIIFDPVITIANIGGNGAFVIFFDRIWTKRSKLHTIKK